MELIAGGSVYTVSQRLPKDQDPIAHGGGLWENTSFISPAHFPLPLLLFPGMSPWELGACAIKPDSSYWPARSPVIWPHLSTPLLLPQPHPTSLLAVCQTSELGPASRPLHRTVLPSATCRAQPPPLQAWTSVSLPREACPSHGLKHSGVLSCGRTLCTSSLRGTCSGCTFL